MEELKTCPFCGGEVQHFETMYHTHCVRCTDCGIGTDFSENANEVIEKWNRRAADGKNIENC